MAYSGLEEVVFHRPLRQVVVNRGFTNPLVLRDCLVIVALDSSQVGHFEEIFVGKANGNLSIGGTSTKIDRHIRLRVVIFVPVRGFLVSVQRFFRITNLDFKHLA